MEKIYVSLYPRDQTRSQMFFLTKIKSCDVEESLRMKKRAIEECAKTLGEECEEYNFSSDKSFCDATDVNLSLKDYENNALGNWKVFFNKLFGERRKSPTSQVKCDIIFRIVYYSIHQERKKTPLHTSLAQSIRDECRSRQFIQVINRLGLCNSYDELEKIDNYLANRTIRRADNDPVSVPASISSSALVQVGMGNFDDEENTPTGKGSSHDTLLMLFHNIKVQLTNRIGISEGTFEVQFKSLD